jgi:hypothetical protein
LAELVEALPSLYPLLKEEGKPFDRLREVGV